MNKIIALYIYFQGKLIDKDLLNSLKSGSINSSSSGGGPKLRAKAQPARPRPKTIHIDSGADAHDGMLTPSRGKKGSSSNLSGIFVVAKPVGLATFWWHH